MGRKMSLAPGDVAKAPSAKTEPTVLVIDPNEEHQALSTMSLGRQGYRVTVAVSGREGLRLALAGRFDAIVIDDRLKDLPSLDVLSVLETRLVGIPKIYVVGPGQERTAEHAMASGAAGILVKTAQYYELLPSEVGNQIRAALARRHLRERERALDDSRPVR